MGLDITAYSNLKRIGQHEKEIELNEGEPGGLADFCYYENHVHAFAYDAFSASLRGIPIIGTRSVEDSSFVEGGCYETTGATETHGFRAGSYNGYNAWRRDLARQFNPDTKPDLPFYELIWFADNEGCIGPDAAADLLADFCQHESAYAPEFHEEYFREQYADWTRAFDLASSRGLVEFH
jgi:hypothetical protein